MSCGHLPDLTVFDAYKPSLCTRPFNIHSLQSISRHKQPVYDDQMHALHRWINQYCWSSLSFASATAMISAVMQTSVSIDAEPGQFPSEPVCFYAAIHLSFCLIWLINLKNIDFGWPTVNAPEAKAWVQYRLFGVKLQSKVVSWLQLIELSQGYLHALL